MRKATLVAAIVGIASSQIAQAQQSDDVIGNFMVHQEKDKFDDSNTIIALSITESNGIALRCIQGVRNVAIAIKDDANWSRGDTGKIKVKIDDKPVQQFNTLALNEKLLEIEDSENLIDTIRNAKEVDVRSIINDMSHDYTFKLIQSGKVVDIVNKGCGVGN